jgi:hypothetical protein
VCSRVNALAENKKSQIVGTGRAKNFFPFNYLEMINFQFEQNYQSVTEPHISASRHNMRPFKSPHSNLNRAGGRTVENDLQ